MEVNHTVSSSKHPWNVSDHVIVKLYQVGIFHPPCFSLVTLFLNYNLSNIDKIPQVHDFFLQLRDLVSQGFMVLMLEMH